MENRNSKPKPSASYLAGDLIGGLLAAIIALPLALAFGVASGLGATAGLYRAIACGVVAARVHVVLASGILFAIVGSIDSLLTAVLADKTTKRRHRSNIELIAQGIGNIASGLIGGIPGPGTTMHGIVNVTSHTNAEIPS